MIPKLDSYLRHVFTSWIAAAVLALTGWFALDAVQTETVTKALEQIGAGVVVLVVTLAPIAGRMLWAWISTGFRTGSGEPGNKDKNSGNVGGLTLWFTMTAATAVILGGALPSCAPGESIPIRARILTPGGSVGYSTKGGLEIAVDATSGK